MCNIGWMNFWNWYTKICWKPWQWDADMHWRFVWQLKGLSKSCHFLLLKLIPIIPWPITLDIWIVFSWIIGIIYGISSIPWNFNFVYVDEGSYFHFFFFFFSQEKCVDGMRFEMGKISNWIPYVWFFPCSSPSCFYSNHLHYNIVCIVVLLSKS